MKSIRNVSLTVCLVAGFAGDAGRKPGLKDKLPRQVRPEARQGEDVAEVTPGARGRVAGAEASERFPLRQVRLLATPSKAKNSTSITAAIPAMAITARPEHGPSSATGATCRQKPDLSRSFGSALIGRRPNPRPPCRISRRKL